MFYRDSMIRFWRRQIKLANRCDSILLQLMAASVEKPKDTEKTWQHHLDEQGMCCDMTVQHALLVVRCHLPKQPSSRCIEIWSKRFAWLTDYCRWHGLLRRVRWVSWLPSIPSSTTWLSFQEALLPWQQEYYVVLKDVAARQQGLFAMDPGWSVAACHRHLQAMRQIKTLQQKWETIAAGKIPLCFGNNPNALSVEHPTRTKGYVWLSFRVLFHYALVFCIGLGSLGVMVHDFNRQQVWSDAVLATLNQPSVLNKARLIQHFQHQVSLLYPGQNNWLFQHAYLLWKQYMSQSLHRVAPMLLSQPLPTAKTWAQSTRQIIAIAEPRNFKRVLLVLLAQTQNSGVGQWMQSHIGQQFWQIWQQWAQQLRLVEGDNAMAQWRWFIREAKQSHLPQQTLHHLLLQAPYLIQRWLMPVLQNYEYTLVHHMQDFILSRWHKLVWQPACNIMRLRQRFGPNGQVVKWRQQYLQGLSGKNPFGFTLPHVLHMALQQASAIGTLLVKPTFPALILTPISLSKHLEKTRIRTDMLQWQYQNGPRHTFSLPWLDTTNSTVAMAFYPFHHHPIKVQYQGQWPVIQWLRHAVISPLGGHTVALSFAVPPYQIHLQLGVAFGDIQGVMAILHLPCG